MWKKQLEIYKTKIRLWPGHESNIYKRCKATKIYKGKINESVCLLSMNSSQSKDPAVIGTKRGPVVPERPIPQSKFSLISLKQTNKQTNRSPNIWRDNLGLPSGCRAYFLTKGQGGHSPLGALLTHIQFAPRKQLHGNAIQRKALCVQPARLILFYHV